MYARKRGDLIHSLDATLSPLFLGHVKNLHKAVVRAFKKEIEEGLVGKEYEFGDVVKKAKEGAIRSFGEGAEGLLSLSVFLFFLFVEGFDWTLVSFFAGWVEVRLKETDWQYEDEFALLKEDIDLIGDQCRSDETKKMINLIEVRFHFPFIK